MSHAEARRLLHGMLHCLPFNLPCADATTPVVQPCYTATKPNFYRSRRYHLDVRLNHSSHLIDHSRVSRSSASRPASEQMTIRNKGVRIAPWHRVRPILLASVLPLGMPDTRMRPRGVRFYMYASTDLLRPRL